KLSGSFANLPADLSANLYRITQEAITNAAKHAGASRIGLDVAVRGAKAVRRREIELIVEDDGQSNDRPVKSGMGLLGMRERVAALGGSMTFEAGRNSGSVLRVLIQVEATPDLSDVGCLNAEVAA